MEKCIWSHVAFWGSVIPPGGSLKNKTRTKPEILADEFNWYTDITIIIIRQPHIHFSLKCPHQHWINRCWFNYQVRCSEWMRWTFIALWCCVSTAFCQVSLQVQYYLCQVFSCTLQYSYIASFKVSELPVIAIDRKLTFYFLLIRSSYFTAWASRCNWWNFVVARLKLQHNRLGL